MLRAFAGATLVLVVVLAPAGAAGSPSQERFLAAAASTLLPSAAEVVARDYDVECYAFLRIESPPCLGLRFRLRGTLLERKAAIVANAEGHWAVRERRHRNGWSLRFTRGPLLRARAEVLSSAYRVRCLSYDVLARSACNDSLRVEFGRPAVFPTIEVPPYLPDLVDPTARTPIPAQPRG
jgi:hypothetical protein